MSADRLIWIDLEMTGLDPQENTIIEIATVITDSQLNIIAEGPSIAIFQPEEELEKMDEWNVTHHTENGLLERVRASEVPLAAAEQRTLEFVNEHCTEGESPLCGNTIGQDRRFLNRHMPDLHKLFHYRSIDVSSLKELAVRWYPALQRYEKSGSHRALDDILESINELRYYRQKLFRDAPAE
jgi:oligoribonuclease